MEYYILTVVEIRLKAPKLLTGRLVCDRYALELEVRNTQADFSPYTMDSSSGLQHLEQRRSQVGSFILASLIFSFRAALVHAAYPYPLCRYSKHISSLPPDPAQVPMNPWLTQNPRFLVISFHSCIESTMI